MLHIAFRSLTTVLTALYLLVSVGACSVPREQETLAVADDVPVSSGPVAVNILQSMPGISLPLQEAAKQYAERVEGEVSFRVQTVASRDDYRLTLRAKLLAGEQVDLFHLLGAEDTLRLRDDLEDLSALSWSGDAFPGALDAVTVDTAVYGVPYGLEATGLIVNRGVFAEAGVSLEEITDFDSLSEAFGELQQKIDAGELSDAYPDLVAVAELPAQDVEYLSLQLAELLLLDAFSSPMQARYSPTADFPSSEGAEALIKLLARVSPQRAAWPDITGVTQRRAVEEGIAAGRVAVVLHSTAVIPRILAENPDLGDQLALLPLYDEESEQGDLFIGPSAWWGVGSAASESAKEQATGFLTWLYQSAEGGAVFAGEFSGLSAYRDTAPTPDSAPYRQLLRAAEQGLARPKLAAEAPSGWGDQFFSPEVRAYFTDYDKEWAAVAAACRDGWAERREAERE